jgi:WD40 repeat protein
LAWDLKTGSARLRKLLNDSTWRDVQISPDGTHLMAVRWADYLKDWQVVLCDVSGRQNSIWLPELSSEWKLAWSPDGKRIALVDGSGNLMVRDTAGHLLCRLEGQLARALSPPAFLSGDNVIVAICGDDGPGGPRRPWSVITWEPARSRLDRRQMPNGCPIGSIVVSRDGRTLAAQEHRVVALWDLSTRTRRYELIGHHDDVTNLAFAPDGRTLATASLDHTVRLWSVASGQDLLVLDGHAGPVRALAFSADGSMLATCGDGPSDRADGSIEVIVWRGEYQHK